MKILLLNDYATPGGGAEILTLGLRDGLRARGHDARLFASSARQLALPVAADYTCWGTTSPVRTLLQTANPWAAGGLRRVLRDFQPDVVHVTLFLTQLSPLILPLLRDVPSVYYAAWYRAVCPLGTKLLPDGRPCRTAAGLACVTHGCVQGRDWAPLMVQMGLWRRWRSAFTRVVAVSEAVRQELINAGIGPVEVAWAGVPTGPARPPLTEPPTVVYAGRLVPEKGVNSLVHAFARVVVAAPTARLLVLGDGPERPRLEALIAGLGLNASVSLIGHLPRAAAERRCESAWVQTVPSHWAEPFGLVAAEAMMRGTAVVASGTGGLREIVRDGKTGLLVPPGDVEALADALTRVLSDRALAEQFGAAGRAMAQATFSEAAFVDRMVAVYAGIVEPLPAGLAAPTAEAGRGW